MLVPLDVLKAQIVTVLLQVKVDEVLLHDHPALAVALLIVNVPPVTDPETVTAPEPALPWLEVAMVKLPCVPTAKLLGE